MVKQENSLTTNVGGDIDDDDDDEEEQTRSSQMISTSPTYTSKEIQLILAQYNNQEQKKLSDRIINNTYDDKPENNSNNNNNNNIGIEQEHTGSKQRMMTSFQLLREKQRSDNDDNCDRFHKIKFKILRAAFCNQLAYKYYSKRQMYVTYLPLQILAMLSSIIGFTGTGGTYDDRESKEGTSSKFNVFSLVEGIIGTMMVFIINLGKNLSYDAKAKEHELIAATMKWLIDDLDILISKTTDGNNIDADADSIAKKGFEKVESDFFSYSQTIQTVLPDKIGLAFSKLQFELKLLRVNKNSVYHNDDVLYYRIVEFAYSELAVILGGRIFFLPTPEVSVKMTIDRINALLPSLNQIKL